MPFSSHTGSAEIIPFPVRFRSPSASFEALKPAADMTSYKIYDAAFGSSWYHQAALEDALRAPQS